MKVKCSFCGKYVDDSDTTCFWCKKELSNFVKTGEGEPSTIDELENWFTKKNFDNENSKLIFINKETNEPNAVGICKSKVSGDVIIYKNDGVGYKSVKYSGSDEEFAVKAFYEKVKQLVTYEAAYTHSFIDDIGAQVVDQEDHKSFAKRESGGIKTYQIVIVAIVVIYLVGGGIASLFSAN